MLHLVLYWAEAWQFVHSLVGGVATTYLQLIPLIDVYAISDVYIECLIAVKATPLTQILQSS